MPKLQEIDNGQHAAPHKKPAAPASVQGPGLDNVDADTR